MILCPTSTGCSGFLGLIDYILIILLVVFLAVYNKLRFELDKRQWHYQNIWTPFGGEEVTIKWDFGANRQEEVSQSSVILVPAGRKTFLGQVRFGWNARGGLHLIFMLEEGINF